MQASVISALRPYVTRISVFGSYARGTAHTDSDLDLLVVLKPATERPSLGLRWFALEAELSEQLGCPVEIVTEAALSPHMRPYIVQDAVTVYEA